MLVVMVGVVTYGTYIMTGRVPWQGLTSLKKPDLKIPELGLPAQQAVKQRFYKWEDEDGVRHFSSEPPGDNLRYEIVEVDPNINVVAPVPLEPNEAVPEQAHEASSDKREADENDSPFPYSPERVKKLMDDARDVQKTLNERAEKQQELLNDL
jgi:hypothetical protein